MQKVFIPKPFHALFNPKRLKIFFGGRGGAKSWSFATALLLMASERKLFIGCFRETQKSLADSSKLLLENRIDSIKLAGFRPMRDEIRCKNGSRFVFYGIRNDPQKIKSLEGIDIAWVEEADATQEQSIDILVPTIRKERSEIWMSMNLTTYECYVYKHFIKPHGFPITQQLIEDDHAYIRRINYDENPMRSADFERERKRYEDLWPLKYQEIYLAIPGASSEEIVHESWWTEYDQDIVLPRLSHIFTTADTAYKTGTGNDYSVLCLWGWDVDQRSLYLIDMIRDKWEYPDLLEQTKTFFYKHYRDKRFLRIKNSLKNYIEDKATGISLCQNLRRQKIPTIPWKPQDYNFPSDKAARLRESAFLIKYGVIQIPEGASFLLEFKQEHSAFREDNSHEHDDIVDNTTMATSIFTRLGGAKKLTLNTPRMISHDGRSLG